MRKSRKRLHRAGAAALAAAMLLTGWGFMPQSAAITAKAAETVVTGVNYAPAGTAQVSDQETEYWGADKAIDGIVNRDAEKADQSRWATNKNEDNPTLTVDLGTERTFNRFVIEWERTNVTGFKIEKSENGTDGWTSVYTKPDNSYVSSTTEIELDGMETARYLRLVVTGYTGTSPDDDMDWRSLSLYEFKVIADVDAVPNVLTNLGAQAEATADTQEAASVAASNGNDGDQSTHWGSGTGECSETTPHWLQLTWDEPQVIQTVKIHWERMNATAYSLQTSENGTDWENLSTYATAPDDYWQTIELDDPLTTQYLRIRITAFNPTAAPEGKPSVTWNSVGVCEFEAYSYAGILETEEQRTMQDIVDELDAPEVSEDGTAVTLPTVDGYKVEILADYEQVVGKDGTIYQPLTDKTVKAIYKLTQGEGEQAESVEGTQEYTLTIPGLHANAGTNPKPTVVPELAEWYGGESAGSFSVANDASVYAPEDFSAAAKAFVEDYNAELGTALKIVNDASAAAIVFEKDSANGLGEEGYIMDIGSDKLTIKADHNTGAYWATRSILQIAELNDGTLPQGITKDYPKYEVRGFMLDVARKPVSMETMEDIAKEMAYYKMNDFHIHLNDNLIFYENYESAEEARELAYTGFRLESEVVEGGNGGLNKADLTNKDLYYTKEDFRNFILSCRSMGVKITPEFDTPGHSGAFTKVRPDLMLAQVQTGQANRAGEQFDLSEGKYDDSLAFVESIWNEYLTDNMFDDSMTVHIGTDEYYGEKDRFRKFSDDLIGYVQDKGYTVRLWGSLSSMPGTTEVRSEGVQMNVWNTSWAKPIDMYNEGFELINTVDGNLYMVPAAGYYFDYLNTQNLYNNWVPNKFGTGTNDPSIPAGSEQMLGSTYAIWNDKIDTQANGISEIDIYDRFADAVPTLASKNWGDPEGTYADMEAAVEALGDAANSNPYYEASADGNGEYMSYEFEDNAGQTDSSANGRDITNVENADITDGSLKLKGGASYVETPIEKLATGNTLEFDITLTEEPQPGAILFEADDPGANDDYAHTIQIMDDGRLGFRRELYDYYFDYTIPVGEKVHLAISTDGTKTTLIADGEYYPAVGKYVNRQTDNKERVDNISISTLLLPLQRIGSETNAISAVIDNVKVLSGAYKDKTVIDSSNFTVTSDNENPLAGSEGPIGLAFDGDTSTFWHSNYTPYQALPATVEIDMGQVYTINKFSYLPRQSGTNGIITEYSLYYKTSADGEWIPLAEEQTWAGDSSQKTVKFDAVETQYLKFVALDGMSDGDNKFASAAEFMVHQVLNEEPEPEVTYTVTFVADGNETTQTVKEGETADKPEAPTKPGHKFLGWFEEGNEAAFDFDTPVTGNVTLTARFEAYTVTPSTDANGTVSAGAMQADGFVTVEAEPNSGYRFAGWKVNDQMVSDENPYTFVPDQDTVITAVFEKIGTPGEGDSDQDKPGTDKPGADTQKPGSGNADKGDKGGNTAVQTGDQSSPVIWAVVLIAACAAVAAVVIIRKKKK